MAPRETCESCGFESEAWSDSEAIEALGLLSARWAEAVAGLLPDQLQRRPSSDMWSIAEYADHVREVLFGMRFVLDSAVSQPGIDLGDPPEPAFSPNPRAVDIDLALAGISQESLALRQRLLELPAPAWGTTAKIAGENVDPHWVFHHAIHDSEHHLGDVTRLRAAL